MAQGPDPNRVSGTDRELSGRNERGGGGFESPPSTRLGLSSGVIVLVVVLLIVALIIAF